MLNFFIEYAIGEMHVLLTYNDPRAAYQSLWGSQFPQCKVDKIVQHQSCWGLLGFTTGKYIAYDTQMFRVKGNRKQTFRILYLFKKSRRIFM